MDEDHPNPSNTREGVGGEGGGVGVHLAYRVYRYSSIIPRGSVSGIPSPTPPPPPAGVGVIINISYQYLPELP